MKIEFKSNDKVPDTLKIIYPPDDISPLGIIHFIHGMRDHKERFYDNMKYFSNFGYICTISDLKGHGENLISGHGLGYFGENGAQTLIEDVHEIITYLKRKFPKLSISIIGHSMGALITRAYLKKYDFEINHVFLTGCPGDNPLKNIGKGLIKSMQLVKGEDYRSPLMENLILGSFNKHFKMDAVKNAWICSDIEVIRKFNNDKLSNFAFTLNGFETLLNLLCTVYSKKGFNILNPDLPIYFMSGDKDSCMVSKKELSKSIRLLRKSGYRNVYRKLYKNMRHEILNEPNKQIVYNDILNKLSK